MQYWDQYSRFVAMGSTAQNARGCARAGGGDLQSQHQRRERQVAGAWRRGARMRVTPASASTLRAGARSRHATRASLAVFLVALVSNLSPAVAQLGDNVDVTPADDGERASQSVEVNSYFTEFTRQGPYPYQVCEELPGEIGVTETDKTARCILWSLASSSFARLCPTTRALASSLPRSTTSRSSSRTRNASPDIPSNFPPSPPPSVRMRSRCISASSRFLGARRTPRTPASTSSSRCVTTTASTRTRHAAEISRSALSLATRPSRSVAWHPRGRT